MAVPRNREPEQGLALLDALAAGRQPADDLAPKRRAHLGHADPADQVAHVDGGVGAVGLEGAGQEARPRGGQGLLGGEDALLGLTTTRSDM